MTYNIKIIIFQINAVLLKFLLKESWKTNHFFHKYIKAAHIYQW